MKQAEKEFKDQHSKTLKNIFYVDKKKSTSSGSLIKKNLGTRHEN